MLARIQAHRVVVEDVTTIDEDGAIEEAARTMADRKIGCLPVMRGDDLVGIITDGDLFGTMVDLLGARRLGVRMTVLQPDRAGEVARLTKTIDEKRGYISVFVTCPTADPGTWVPVVKVTDVPRQDLEEIVSSLKGNQVQDVREVSRCSQGAQDRC